MTAIHEERSALPEWLRSACHAAAPDPCEAIALMEDAAGRTSCPIALNVICEDILKAARYDAGQKAIFITHYWEVLDEESLYQFNRMITGTLSLDLPRNTWLSAVAGHFKILPALLSYRLSQKRWTDAGIDALIDPLRDLHVSPLPFPETHVTPDAPAFDGTAWSIHWHRSGTEAQLVKRNGTVTLWGKDLNILNDQHDHLLNAAGRFPDGTVLYGILVPTADGPNTSGDGPGPFLQVVDVWEWQGRPPEPSSPEQRVNMLRSPVEAEENPYFIYPETLYARDEAELKALHRRSRLAGAIGLLLMPVGSEVAVPGSLISWTAAPHRLKAVLLYAQRSDGVQGPLYSFALARGRDWVTVARTGEGLNNDDRDALEKFIKENTLQRFGPVRTVKAIQVMELAVDRIRTSTRHKSGYLLEGVRITAWRKDLGTEMADDLSVLNSMIDQ
jgi:DNA ligase-1